MIKSPQISHYISMLGRLSYRNYGDDTTYDADTYTLIDTIINTMQQIKPASENSDARVLWITSDRGEFKDYIDDEELAERLADGETVEEIEKEWHDFFPKPTQWYRLAVVHDKYNDYKTIIIDNKQVLEIDPEKKHESHPYKVQDFAEWILDAVNRAIELLKSGQYMDIVREQLPYEQRTGTIIRKDLYDIFPDWREAEQAEFTADQIAEFKEYITAPKHDNRVDMSAFEFYSLCSVGYKECGYDCDGLTPKELYYKYADGRDAGLRDINMHSTTAFYAWYENLRLGRTSGHPWEVIRGGNSTHVDLFVHYDDDGVSLTVCGDNRCPEAVKFFIAIYRAGCPVELQNAELLSARINETEKIGIVPRRTIPRYCSGYFPNEAIIDYMNLPFENTEAVIKAAHWYDLDEIELNK